MCLCVPTYKLHGFCVCVCKRLYGCDCACVCVHVFACVCVCVCVFDKQYGTVISGAAVTFMPLFILSLSIKTHLHHCGRGGRVEGKGGVGVRGNNEAEEERNEMSRGRNRDEGEKRAEGLRRSLGRRVGERLNVPNMEKMERIESERKGDRECK